MEKTTREKFDNEFPRIEITVNESPWDRDQRVEIPSYVLWSFIESIEKEALARGEKIGGEKMKKKCLKCLPLETPLSQLDTMAGKDIKEAENNLLWEIKHSVSSL